MTPIQYLFMLKILTKLNKMKFLNVIKDFHKKDFNKIFCFRS